jgi:hypothetical protein
MNIKSLSCSSRRWLVSHRRNLTLLTSFFCATAFGGVASAADRFASGTETGSLFRITPDGTQMMFSTVSPRAVWLSIRREIFTSPMALRWRLSKSGPAECKALLPAALNEPRGIAFDTEGNLFVCNAGDNEILKFTPTGAQSTFASGLNRPSDISFDADGNLFESDRLGGSPWRRGITPRSCEARTAPSASV